VTAAEEPRTRVLVVANRTAQTPELLDAVRARALQGACEFFLLIPDAGSRNRTDWNLESALPMMRRAAGRAVQAIDGGDKPCETVAEAVRAGRFDEVIVSTLPHKAARLMHRDLPQRISRLDVPVTVIEPGRRPGMSLEDGSLALLTGVPRRGR
jgi:hypothetical protein